MKFRVALIIQVNSWRDSRPKDKVSFYWNKNTLVAIREGLPTLAGSSGGVGSLSSWGWEAEEFILHRSVQESREFWEKELKGPVPSFEHSE